MTSHKRTESRSPLSLQEAIRQSTSQWQNNLDSLFQHAKDRFPDLVWEIYPPDDAMLVDDPPRKDAELVWAHKAIVYARAPPPFQNRYFAFRQNGNGVIRSPSPFGGSPEPANYLDVSVSNVSLSLRNLDEFPPSRSPSPRSRPQSRGSLAPSVVTISNTAGMLRLRTFVNHALFSNELEYLYTGQGFGEAFEFLFDTPPALSSTTSLNGDGTRQVVSTPRTSLNLDSEATSTQARVDKLRKDLVYMWRSRLYSDVRIALTGEFSSLNHETSTAIFSSHKFILVSRCEYFKTALMDWPASKSANKSLMKHQDSGEPVTLTLPSPPFTPASLHFTLGYIYTGTLVFSHRTYDLSTALSLLRSADYLSLDALYDEIQARIVQEMMHGLGHAFLEWSAWESMGGGRFPTPGCRCRSCLRRAPRILQFSVEPDVNNIFLERGARRVLVGAFGEGWCTSEFASLPPQLRQSLLKGVRKRTTSQNSSLPSGNGRGNVFRIIWNAEEALRKLQNLAASAAKKARRQPRAGEDEEDEGWIEVVKEMITLGRRGAEEVLASESVECFSFPSPTSQAPSSQLLSMSTATPSSHPTTSFGHHEQGDWEQLMYSDGDGFDDSDRLTWIFEALKRGLDEGNAAIVYQTLVEKILLLQHPDHPDKPFLGNRSKIRGIVEGCRMDVLRWIRKRWINMVPLGAFESLEDWSLKEISDHIEVPVEDLLLPPGANHSMPHSRHPTSGSKPRSAALRDNRSEASSLHASVLPGAHSIASSAKSGVFTARRIEKAAAAANSSFERPDSKFTSESEDTGRRTPTSYHTRTGAISPSGSSIYQSGRRTPTHARSGAISPSPSAYSLRSARAGAVSPSRRRTGDSSPPTRSRSASPASGIASRRGSVASTGSTATTGTVRRTSGGSQGQASLRSSGTTGTGRGSSVKASILSNVASSASAVSLRQGQNPHPESRPASDASLLTASTSSTESANSQAEYKTATDSTTGRSRKGSVASVVSARSSLSPSVRQSHVASGSTGHHLRPPAAGTRQRQASSASVSSNLSTTSASPTSKRPPSVASSIRSTTSTHSNSPAANARKAARAATAAARNKQSEWKSTLEKEKEREEKEKGKGPEKKVDNASSTASSATPTASSITVRPTKPSPGTPSSTSTIRKKGSSDTITGSRRPNTRAPPLPSVGVSPRKNIGKSSTVPKVPPKDKSKGKENMSASVPAMGEKNKDGMPLSSIGASLDIGIPCIISSRSKRFKAYARYIGGVEGEMGSWVGVEVPMDDSWSEDEIMGGVGDNLAMSAGSLDGRETPAVGEGPHGRQWNDGTWGGIRYFEIGSTGSECDYEDKERGRGSKRRRMDWSDGGGMSTMGRHGLKRQGDSTLGIGRTAKRMRSSSPSLLSDSGIESRGLFVRPSQVLYVVDA